MRGKANPITMGDSSPSHREQFSGEGQRAGKPRDMGRTPRWKVSGKVELSHPGLRDTFFLVKARFSAAFLVREKSTFG